MAENIELTLIEQLNAHKRHRAFFFSSIGIIATLFVIGGIISLMDGGIASLIPVALGLYWLAMVVKVGMKYDPILFQMSDEVNMAGGKLDQAEGILKAVFLSEMQDNEVRVTEADYENLNFPQFARKSIEEIQGSVRRKREDDMQTLTRQVVEAQRELSKAKLEYGEKVQRLETSTQLQLKDKEDEVRNLTGYALVAFDDKALAEQISKRFSSRNFSNKDQASNLVQAALECFPSLKDELKPLAHVSEERKRINQYDTILRLYNDKIAGIRAEEMDDEDREDAIVAMKRLRDREIEILERA